MTEHTRPPLSPTPRSTLNRSKHRARTDRAELDAVLDEGVICHLGVRLGDAPVVLPMAYGRAGDVVYLHCSTGAGGMRAALDSEVSVAVTHVDGLVLARSAMHFSMNYRSAVVRGQAVEVADPEARLAALRVIVEHSAPGSWDRVRPPNRKELAATLVFALDLTEASLKVRTGGPVDEAEDVAAGGVWAGTVPLRQVWGEPVPAADLEPGIPVPEGIVRGAGTPRSDAETVATVPC